MNAPIQLNLKQARKIILSQNRLSQDSKYFGTSSPITVQKIIEHLGYVQIDTIFVVERSHHHILFNRLPDYRRSDLSLCQSNKKSVFESWTHALSYVPTRDLKYYVGPMKAWGKEPSNWFSDVTQSDFLKLKRKIARSGPLTIRDMDDTIPGKKNDWWDSNKPSKKILQFGFHAGEFAISKRIGIVKEYELFNRHFKDHTDRKAVKESERMQFLINRAFSSQAIASLDSICHLRPSLKPMILKQLEKNKKVFQEIKVSGLENTKFWIQPDKIDGQLDFEVDDSKAHILSPFDPITIQRKRLKMFFNFDYLFEAYVPEKKRKFGYFLLPVLIGDRIVAGLDLKTDRINNKLIIKNFHWFTKKSKYDLKLIEESLNKFENFQLDWKN